MNTQRSSSHVTEEATLKLLLYFVCLVNRSKYENDKDAQHNVKALVERGTIEVTVIVEIIAAKLIIKEICC